MSRVLVLDSEAVWALGLGNGRRFDEVRAALTAAQRLGRRVVVPTVVLAELYRGPRLNQVVDSCLARETALELIDTGRALAKLVGGVLAAAGASSEDLVDAHCVSVAVDTGGGVVITGDPDDLERLATAYPNVHIAAI